MIGFLLGEKFTFEKIKHYGKEVSWISICAALGTSLIVFCGLLVFGVPFPLALLLGGIAAATDPAATIDVINEVGDESDFSDKLFGVVALDDAIGLIVFSLFASIALSAAGNGDAIGLISNFAKEIGGAILLGLMIGLPAAFFTGRIAAGHPTLIEVLGIVFICAAVSLWLEVSYLIASMVMGAVVANLASHHERPFHEIEGIEDPFLILFFILAGASLELSSIMQVGGILAIYLVARFAGKLLGGWLGGFIGGSDIVTRRFIGFALMPQAGVAIGMALIAIERFPEYRDILLPTVIGSTVIFELIGPLCTRLAIHRSGRKAA
jgi:Kef-type K+ transport system membrane component KefB